MGGLRLLGGLRRLPGFRGRIGRLAYLGSFAAAFLVAWGFSRLADAARAAGAAGDSALAWGGLCLTLAMVYTVVCLNARRLRDAGASPWWGCVPFVLGIAAPVLTAGLDPSARAAAGSLGNALFVLTLALLRPRGRAPVPALA